MLQLLESFIAVVELGSLSKASEALHTSQPNLSLRIQQLEKQLNVQLFDREGKKLVLNPIGQKLYHDAKVLSSMYTTMQKDIQMYSEQSHGHLRIGAGFSIFYSILYKFFQTYQESAEHITYRLVTGNSDEIYNLIEQYELDFGFVTTPQKNKANMVHYPLLETQIGLIGPADLDFKQRGPKRILQKKDIEQLSFISFKKETGLMNFMQEVLNKEGLKLRVKMEVDQLELQVKMVEVGLGVAFVPLPAAREAIEQGSVQFLPLSDFQFPVRHIYLIHRANRYFPAAFEQFKHKILAYYH